LPSSILSIVLVCARPYRASMSWTRLASVEAVGRGGGGGGGRGASSSESESTRTVYRRGGGGGGAAATAAAATGSALVCSPPCPTESRMQSPISSTRHGYQQRTPPGNLVEPSTSSHQTDALCQRSPARPDSFFLVSSGAPKPAAEGGVRDGDGGGYDGLGCTVL
jgi:hypothetical protein